MAEAAEEVEEWVALTQATLGQLIAKPRMLAERLRKPPFRFLFDVAAEVARQTGFGLQELFGGELGAKPSIPGTREEKVSFLECWISLTSAMLGQQAPTITLISAQSIVCGIHPELTNYLLQCTAAACWPENCAPPAPPAITTTVPPEAGMEQAAEAWQAPSPEPPQEAAPFQEAAPAPAPPVQEVPQVPAPSLEEQLCPSLNVEQARDIAAGMDFTTALQEYDQMQQDFARTTGNFNFAAPASPEAVADEAAAAAAAQAAVADEAAAEARPATGAAAPLEHAAAVTQKVNTEIQRAADLLACIEEGLDEADARIQEKRAAEARKQQEAAEAAARAEAEAQEEARQAAEREALKRQAKEEARARRKAEKEAAELAAKFPMSKTSMGQSTRIVCSLGDDLEDAEEGGEEDAAAGGRPEGERAAESGGADSALPMAGCFTDEVLGSSSSSKPAPASLGFLNPTQKEASLFERLKGELKDTFVSYLCASMPESLLKKYQPDELIGCLQLLLTELRKCIAEHGLEDVHDEEPTSLAEDLHKEFPNDWLPHLQGASPWSLRQRYDLPELIDTLQGLGQTCFERLTDELGPITQWASEESPLRKPPAEPPAPLVMPQEDDPSLGGSSPSAGLSSPVQSPPPAETASGLWSAALGPAPWEAAGPPATAAPPTRAGAPPTAGGRVGAPPTRGGAPLVVGPPPTAGGHASAEAHLRTVQQTSGGASSPAPPPVFSAALGPAPWEMDGPSPGPAPATAARMPTGAGRMPTAQRQPMHGTQRPVTQQPPRTAAMHQGFAVTSR